MTVARLWLGLAALTLAAAAVDHGMKLQQTLGSTIVAAKSKDYDTAFAKMDEMAKQLNAWREALKDAKKQASEPVAEQAPPEPPAEKIEFSINSTHVPEKCPRQSVAGATMKVHYVGKLLKPGGKPGKIFASSFHTGSMPFKFTLGSDDVVEGWNKGLGGMCEGERRRLMVPWDMAYGAKGGKGVPPYSDVQYDFELVELNVPKVPKAKKSEL